MIAPEHIAQTLGYLRASGHRDAPIINFGTQATSQEAHFVTSVPFVAIPP